MHVTVEDADESDVGRELAPVASKLRPVVACLRSGCVLWLGLIATFTSGAAEVPRLWFTQAAAKWDEALPVGNGRMGAMVFGGPVDERIQFNEDTLWTGHPHDYVRAGASDALPEVRKLLADGKVKEAEQLARTRLLSDPVRQKAYQPFGDIRIHFDGHEHATDYQRELDLDAAVARTKYRTGNITYTEEVFASYPDQVIVVHLSASKPGAMNFAVRLDSPHKDSQTTANVIPGTASDGMAGESARRAVQAWTDGAERSPAPYLPILSLTGRVQPDGLRFEAQLRVLTSGGKVTADGTSIRVEKANSVTLVLAAATSFKNFQDISADPHNRVERTLAQIHLSDNAASYAALRARHEADYRALFRRVTLDLGATPAATLSTDERVRRVKATGGIDADPALAALDFQYGRYLLIASSRPGSQPANLQGIWNELLAPPWESKWTTNINVEMNYWPAEITNLSECHQPLFDLIRDLTISGARTAREEYGARGWVLHHNTDLWRGTAPINNIDGVWPTGGAWLCYHLWEHWLFTRDRKFLAQEAYPALRGAALYFVDALQRDPKTGWLVTTPSFSPEQGTMTIGPTMDIQLIRSLWENTIAAAKTLGIDADFAQQLAALLPQLPPNQIGKYGQLQEWLSDVDVPNNNHRHLSPLWALYPGADITPSDPKFFDAAKVLLKWRGDGSTGWSYAWRIPLWARVGDAEFAYRQLSLLLAKRTLLNLFDLCGPFQIDGNFGATAGLTEMLLQSHLRAGDNADTVIINLLPALPKEWPNGSVTGLCARDGFEVDIEWREKKLTHVAIRSRLGLPCVLRYAGTTKSVHIAKDHDAVFNGELK